MIDYKQVVEERYNKESLEQSYGYENPYSLLNPIGFYTQQRIDELIRYFVLEIKSRTNGDACSIKLLDVGCGKGGWTRRLVDFVGIPQNIYGLELSENRLNHCKEMNPAIKYGYADITEPILCKVGNTLFDGVVCADVLMHIRRREDVINAIKNIRDVMKPGGVLMWYDTLADTHFERYDADCQGFSEKEMDTLTKECDLRFLKSYSLFKQIKIGKHIFSTVYHINERNVALCRIIEKIPFGKPVVTCRLYTKE